MNRKLLAGLVAFSLWGFAAPAWSQDPTIAELYGRGVHAYNSKDYAEAHEQLNEAIEQGSQDPRVFYYRGLVYAKTGRPEQAEQDFRKGADFELNNDQQVYNIGKALERVQGSVRLDIEKHRRQARVALARQGSQTAQAKYEKALADQDRVTRKPLTGTEPAAPDAVAPAPKAGDPFNEGVGVGAAEKAPEKKPVEAPKVAGAGDPFGEAQPMPKTPAADPFAETVPADPLPKTPADPADPADAADPFSEPKPAPKVPAEDPFGADEPAPAPAPTPKAPAEDPFGADEPAPAPMPKPAPKPAEDPFGDDPAPADPADPAPGDPAPAPMASAKRGGLFGSIFRAAVKGMPVESKEAPMNEAAPATAPSDKPVAPGEDPFDAPAPAPAPKVDAAPPADDPFDAPAPAPAPKAAEPPADDPFGADPAPAKPADPKPADPKDDPFGN